jgi:hypothetical protein
MLTRIVIEEPRSLFKNLANGQIVGAPRTLILKLVVGDQPSQQVAQKFSETSA